MGAPLPPEQGAKGEARHHQQGVANGDRKRIVRALGQEESQQAWARQQPGIEADQGQEQKRQAVAKEVAEGPSGGIHQLLKQQEWLRQHPLENRKAAAALAVPIAEVLTEVLHHEALGVVV